MNLQIALVFSLALLVQGSFGLKSVTLKNPFLDQLKGSGGPTGRITGGVEAVPNSIPFQVALLIPTPQGTGFCGGSLISQTVVLTAAHCAEISSTIDVVLGAHAVQNDSESTQIRIRANNIIIHPEWSSSTLRNDIALILLPVSIILNDNIQVVRLPSRSDIGTSFADDLSTVSGWGRQSDESTSISETLRQVQVRVITNLRCGLVYLGVIQNTHVCTSGEEGRSTCNGDSGGPLVSSSGTQIGIVSFGISLGCEVGFPAVFTRVTEYLNWIDANTNDVVIQN